MYLPSSGEAASILSCSSTCLSACVSAVHSAGRAGSARVESWATRAYIAQIPSDTTRCWKKGYICYRIKQFVHIMQLNRVVERSFLKDIMRRTGRAKALNLAKFDCRKPQTSQSDLSLSLFDTYARHPFLYPNLIKKLHVFHCWKIPFRPKALSSYFMFPIQKSSTKPSTHLLHTSLTCNGC